MNSCDNPPLKGALGSIFCRDIEAWTNQVPQVNGHYSWETWWQRAEEIKQQRWSLGCRRSAAITMPRTAALSADHQSRPLILHQVLCCVSWSHSWCCVIGDQVLNDSFILILCNRPKYNVSSSTKKFVEILQRLFDSGGLGVPSPFGSEWHHHWSLKVFLLLKTKAATTCTNWTHRT